MSRGQESANHLFHVCSIRCLNEQAICALAWRCSSMFVCSLHMQVVFSRLPSANIFALARRCSVWSFVNIPTMKLWFLSDLPNLFHISEEGTSDGERL